MKDATGKDLADAGIACAQAHAEAVKPGWTEECMYLLRQFVKNRNKAFAFEEFREHVTIKRPDLIPPHHGSWGALARRAVSDEVVRYTGEFRPAKSRLTHGHLVRLMTRMIKVSEPRK